MTPPTSTAHRVLLGLSAVLLGALGVLLLAVPAVLADRVVDTETPGALSAMLRIAGAALLGEVTAIVLALRSRSAAVVGVVSLMLIVHFTVETVARIGSYISGESSSLMAAVPQALLAIGLAFALGHARNRSSRPVAAESDASA